MSKGPSFLFEIERIRDREQSRQRESTVKNTVKRLNIGHLQVLKNLCVIKRWPLLGGSLTNIVTFGTKHFICYSSFVRFLGCPLLGSFTVKINLNFHFRTSLWRLKRFYGNKDIFCHLVICIYFQTVSIKLILKNQGKPEKRVKIS